MFARVLVGLLRVYQRTLSPDHGWVRGAFPLGCCRYEPTCSEYLRQAVGRFGARAGLRLGLQRLLRCHPWAAGGDDPVPARRVAR